MLRLLFLCLLLLTGLSFPRSGYAHPLSISDAYVLIEPERLLVRLEVFVEDLYLFHELPLNADEALAPAEVDRGIELHKQFLLDKFVILQNEQERLAGTFLQVDRSQVPTKPIPFNHLMSYKLHFEYAYPLQAPPEFLTFMQEFVHPAAVLPTEVQVKVKPLHGRRHQQLILPHQPWTIRLEQPTAADQSQPRLSPAEQFEQLRQETLGITSFGETYVFLYLEPQEIRVETLLPLATLARSLEQPIPFERLLELSDQQALRPGIERLFSQQVVCQQQTATGWQTLVPQIDSINYFGVTSRDFSLRRSPEAVHPVNARVGVIMRFPLPEGSKRGQLQWNLFNQYLYQVNLAVLTSDTTERALLQQAEGENTFDWQIDEPAPAESTGVDSVLTEQRSNRLQVELPRGAIWWKPAIALGLLGVMASCVVWQFGRRSPERSHRKHRLLIAGALGLAVLCGLWGWASQQLTTPLMAEEEAPDVSRLVLEEIYAAFNRRDEQEIFSHLEQVVDGKLLRDLYLEIRQSMTIEEQGGSLARAGQVTLQDCYPTDALPRFPEERFAQTLTCRWEVPGKIEHWGHIHRRTTGYLARLTFAPRAEATGIEQAERWRWKLIAVDLLNQDQSLLETSVRRF